MADTLADNCVICSYPAKMRCSGCRDAMYCSPEHQALAWKKHKKLCRLKKDALAGKPMPPKDKYCDLCRDMSGSLMQTECCGSTVCDDHHKYKMFTFSNDSCARNHDRYTHCCYHYNERHDKPDWKTCTKCLNNSGDPERTAWQMTNNFNFERIDKKYVPTFKPSHCEQCGKHVKKNAESCSALPGGKTTCHNCMNSMLGR